MDSPGTPTVPPIIDALARLLLEHGPNAMMLCERGRVAYANPATFRMLQLASPDELMGWPLLDLLPDPAIPAALAAVEAAPVWFDVPEKTFRSPNGIEVPVDVRLGSYRVDDRIVVFVGCHDRSQHVDAALRIQRELDRFQAMTWATGDVIWDWDLVTDGLWWNENFERHFGYPLGGKESTIQSWTDRIHPEDQPRIVASIHEVIEKGGQVWVEEYRFQRADGTYTAVFDRGRVLRDESGRAVRMVGSMQDITERKKYEAALLAETAMLDAQLESSLDGIAVVDPEGRTIIQNNRFVDMWGLPPELAGEADNALVLEFALSRMRDPEAAMAEIERLRANPAARSHTEFELLDGTALELYSAPVLGRDGKHYGRIWSFRDITEKRQAEAHRAALEEQLRHNQKLEALGTLAGGIAHDFNNILTAIIGNQQLALMDSSGPEDLRRSLVEIGRAASRAARLVEQILTFSRQQQVERRVQYFQHVVAEAVDLVRASLPTSIAIEQVYPEKSPVVSADTTQMHQVVMNLCTNAAQAMQGRPGLITVKLDTVTVEEEARADNPDLRPGPYARLSVTDSGLGMAPDVVARIFEPFFTTKGPRGGTGLGLAVVHGIVRDHDGVVRVHTTPGVGSTFEVFLPLANEADIKEVKAPLPLPRGRGESLMVVDDEAPVARVTSSMLQKHGYRVEFFDDSREALARFEADPLDYDLLVTDRTMPHLSGPELIAHMRARRPDLPAIVMSGFVGPLDGASASSEYRLLPKPVDFADLAHAVHRLLSESRRDSIGEQQQR